MSCLPWTFFRYTPAKGHVMKAQIAQASQDRDAKAESKAKNLQAKADATGDLKDTTTTRDADSKYLADLTAT